MYDITIDLPAGLATMAPHSEDDQPAGFSFDRIDLSNPGCIIFYKYGQPDLTAKTFVATKEEYIRIIPWTSINIINFETIG